MRVNYIKLNQDGIKMYLLKLGVEDLINNSIIERYDTSKDTGYQRQPIPSHYKKISKYFMETTNAILPTAVLAAINPEFATEIDDLNLELNSKIRIVDGQHRIKGLEELKKGYTTNSIERFRDLCENYEFPIVLMVIPPDPDLGVSVLEVDSFININNKGKKLNTNLAKELSEKNHRRTYINDHDSVEYNNVLVATTATRIIRELSENTDSIWYNNIILGDAVDNKKPISINAFSKAIKPIVNQYLNKIQTGGKIETTVLHTEESNIKSIIDSAWNIVIERWPDCFTKDKKFHSDYNICKGIGVFPMYGLYSDCLEKNNVNIELTFKQFEDFLMKSKIISSDWLVGGRFTGMTSGQAINQLIKIIKNEQE